MKNVKYPMNLQLFAEGDPNPEPTPQDPPADPQPTKTFTQEDMDRAVTDRLARERKKYGDYDDLKAELTKLKSAEEERQKAEMSATERAEAERTKALERAEAAEKEKENALSAANQRLINAEFRDVARELKLRPDAVKSALKLVDLSAVEVDGDGNVKGLQDAVKALIEDNPYMVEQAPVEPRTIGEPSGGEAKPLKTKGQLLAEAAEKVRENPTYEAVAKFTQLKRELS
ncbi:scaffolding protein [Paenibacillus sp. FSL H7-0940]|uniref:phage scaffolding protein n=1 Tax=Paenibacillus sp. FSL H7-0940 TaxID=2921443 RepID=UPI0030EB7BB9